MRRRVPSKLCLVPCQRSSSGQLSIVEAQKKKEGRFSKEMCSPLLVASLRARRHRRKTRMARVGPFSRHFICAGNLISLLQRRITIRRHHAKGKLGTTPDSDERGAGGTRSERRPNTRRPYLLAAGAECSDLFRKDPRETQIGGGTTRRRVTSSTRCLCLLTAGYCASSNAA